MEVRAATDFAQMDARYRSAADRAIEALEQVWIPAMVDAVEDWLRGQMTTDPAALADIRIVPLAPGLLGDLMFEVAQGAAQGARFELGAQGGSVPDVDDGVLRGRVDRHAAAVMIEMANGVSLAAARKAVQVAGGADDPEAVIREVRAYLEGLEHRWEEDQVVGAMQQAENAARFEVFSLVPDDEPVEFHASELLDAATCSECRRVDGREYATLEQAMVDYPSGGFRSCKGGPRCRGTVVAVLPGEF